MNGGGRSGKFLGILAGWLALEFLAFYGMYSLFGGDVTIWVLVGFIILGCFINPPRPNVAIPGTNPGVEPDKIPKSYLPRKLAAVCFMIPTYLTKIVGILLLIAPVRRFIQRRLIQKLLPPGMDTLFNGGFPGMGGAQSGNPFAGFGQNMGGFGGNSEDAGSAGHSRRAGGTSGDFIDIDYDIEGGKRGETVVEVERPYSNEKKAPKALDAEIIDVDHEWKS